MKHLRITKLILAALAFALLFSACAPKPAPVNVGPSISVAGHTIDLKALYDKANNYYHVGVTNYEVPLQKLDAAYEQAYNEFLLGVRDLMAVRQNCFVNVATTETQIVDAALGNMEPGQLINALATTNLTGEQATTTCAQGYDEVADYTITHRSDLSQKYLARYGLAVDYEAYFSDFIEVDIMNDLAQTYGDSTLVYQKLADVGIPGITDWSWLPTRLLKATHANESICRYYMSGDFMDSLPLATKLKFKGHETAIASMFEATWIPAEANGGQVGLCTMYRWAAIRWYQRDVLSQAAQNALSGTGDQGAIPTLPPLNTPIP